MIRREGADNVKMCAAPCHRDSERTPTSGLSIPAARERGDRPAIGADAPPDAIRRTVLR